MIHHRQLLPPLAALTALLAFPACDRGTVIEPSAQSTPIAALANAQLTTVDPEVVWESYWYSRYNMMSLMLMSGIGEPSIGDTSHGAVITMNQFMAMVPQLMGMALLAEAVMMLKDMMADMTGSEYTASHAGNRATIIAGVDLSELASNTGQYPMIAIQLEQMLGMPAGMISGMVATMANGMVDALDVASLDTSADLALAIQALTWHNLIGNSTAAIGTLASTLAATGAADIMSMSHKLRGLLDAQRLGIDDYASDIEALWEQIKTDYDGVTGRFASKATFTADDVAVILGVLNTLRLVPPNQDPVLTSEANALLLGFFEATTRVLQLSAPPKVLGDGTPVLKGMYEATLPDSWYGHRDVKAPPLVGTAPVFGSSITFSNGRYTLDGRDMDTAGNMHLSTELMWFRISFLNGFLS